MSGLAALYGAQAGLQLAAGYFAAENIKATAELNRDIAEMNAEFAELDAYDAEIEGYTAQAKYQKVIDQTLSDQQLALSAANIDTSFGTAGAIREESKFIADLNKMEIEKRAQERTLGYEREARAIRMGSTLDFSQAQARASQVMFQSVLGASQSGLTGYQRSR